MAPLTTAGHTPRALACRCVPTWAWLAHVLGNVRQVTVRPPARAWLAHTDYA